MLTRYIIELDQRYVKVPGVLVRAQSYTPPLWFPLGNIIRSSACVACYVGKCTLEQEIDDLRKIGCRQKRTGQLGYLSETTSVE